MLRVHCSTSAGTGTPAGQSAERVMLHSRPWQAAGDAAQQDDRAAVGRPFQAG